MFSQLKQALQEAIQQEVSQSLNESVMSALDAFEREAHTKGVDLELYPLSNKIILGWIARRDGTPKGEGAAIIQKIISYADNAKIPVSLDIESRDKSGELSGVQQIALINYYKRFGFKLNPKWKFDSNEGMYTSSGPGAGFIMNRPIGG